MNLFLGNFDFEHHLGPACPRALSAQIRRLNEERAFCLVPLVQPGDCLWTPLRPESGFSEHLQEIGLPRVQFVSRAQDIPASAVLMPWGWCQAVETWAAKCGCVHGSVDLAAVARANSREFSSALETEWNVGLAGARAIRTRADLDRILSEAVKLPAGWVIKANFGMSARERILARRSTPRAQDVEWARRRIELGEPVFFEPWVGAVAEFGCQFSIPSSGSPSLEGITGLLTDRLGTYRGSRVFGGVGALPSDVLEPSVLEVVERAAQRVQQLGYCGPLGIDVMQYRTSGGEIGWRPLQDINARLTMGRVALGLRRLLKADESADWLHFRRPGSATAADSQTWPVSGRLPADARAIRTSPLEIGGRPASVGTLLVIARSTDVLDRVPTHSAVQEG